MAPSGDATDAVDASISLASPTPMAARASMPASTSTLATPTVIHRKIYDSILDLIGNTPIVRLTRLPKLYGVACQVLVKCEYMSPGGSIKDRIALRMVQEAEREKRIHPSAEVGASGGSTLIEPTSGNTGIGLALVGAVKGYSTVITMPEKMSAEKVNILKALGATIYRTPTSAAWDSPLSHMSLAARLVESTPNSAILDQYSNPYNPLTHYHTTAAEILAALQSDASPALDVVVIGAGTGGSVTGMSRRLKEAYPSIKVIGVDPIGSILAEPESLNINPAFPYQVEGIGYDFIPKSLDRSLVDEWIKSNDRESFLMARQLIRLEGLLVGGSSGAAMSAALKAAQNLSSDQKILVILPDSVRNYMTKFLADEWMIMNDFLPSPITTTAATLVGKTFRTVREWIQAYQASVVRTPVSVHQETSMRNALARMKFDRLAYLLVHDSTEAIVGMVTPVSLQQKDTLLEGLFSLSELVRLGMAISIDDVDSMQRLDEKLSEADRGSARTLLMDLILLEREEGKMWKVNGVIGPADYCYYQFLMKEHEVQLDK